MLIITPTKTIATDGTMRIEAVGHTHNPRFVVMVVDTQGTAHQIAGSADARVSTTMMVGFARRLMVDRYIYIDNPNYIEAPPARSVLEHGAPFDEDLCTITPTREAVLRGLAARENVYDAGFNPKEG